MEILYWVVGYDKPYFVQLIVDGKTYQHYRSFDTYEEAHRYVDDAYNDLRKGLLTAIDGMNFKAKT